MAKFEIRFVQRIEYKIVVDARSEAEAIDAFDNDEFDWLEDAHEVSTETSVISVEDLGG